MSESLPASDPGTQKRRSTRIVQAVPITVSGTDALGQPFKERTTTVMVNCHGCKYQSKHYVPKNSAVTLEIPRMEAALPPRIVSGHVVWVQRPRTVRELFQIGLEFESAANVWGIAFPPEDWVPSIDEPAAAISTPSEALASVIETSFTEISSSALETALATPEKAEKVASPIPAPPAAKAPIPPPPAARSTAPVTPAPPVAKVPLPAVPAPTATSAGSTPAAAPNGESKVHVMPSPAAPPAPSQDAQLAVARQMAKIVAEAKETLDKTLRRGAQTAINEEMTMVRQQLDAQMHDTIEHAIKSSMERVSEAEVKKVVQQAATKTAAIVEEARLASEAKAQQIDDKIRQAVQETVSQATGLVAKEAAEQAAGLNVNLKQTVDEAVAQAIAQREANVQPIDEKVRLAVQETVGHAAQQAAKDAAEQASSLNLKQSVEEAVGRAIAEREANMPSPQVLASPEATQQHLDDWKRNLEQTAQDVRGQVVAQSQAEAEAASRRWHEEFEAMLAGSSTKMGEKLTEASQLAIAGAEAQISERNSGLRALLDDVISGAEASIQSLGAGLEQQRANAEHATAQLEETARTTVEQTRQRMDEMAAAQQQAIGGKINEAIFAAETTVQSLSTRLEQERIQAEQAAAQIADSARFAVDQTRQRMDEMAAAHQQTIGGKANEVIFAAETAVQSLSTRLEQERIQAGQVAAQIADSARYTVEQTRQSMDEMVAAQQEAIGQRAEHVISERIQQLVPVLQNSAQKVMEHFSGELEQKFTPKLDAAQRAAADLSNASQQAWELQNSIREQLDTASEHAAQIQDATRERLHQDSEAAVQSAVIGLANTRHQADQLQNYLRQQVQQASEHVSLLQTEARERVQRESGLVVEKAVAELGFAGQEAARLQDAIREQTQKAWEAADQIGGASLEKVQIAAAEAVQRAIVDLAGAEQQAAQLQNSIYQQVQLAAAETSEFESRTREQMQQASEETVQQTVERLRQETAKYPAEIEAACRDRINKVEEELDQKSSEVQHSAYEALLKSSEWYQKKAQTTMQSTMERVVEQSSNALRDKAQETSSLVASELDHYRRNYVEHGRAEIEDAAKEVLDRERGKLNETAEIANATFTDRVQHITADSLRRFQEVSREALEKTRSDMEYNREGSLADFQKTLDEKMMLSVEQAGTYLQSQLVPMLESWEARREAEKKEWMEQVKKSSEESLEAYKARLENTTNGWLLASAATLGQNSQAVLDTLAKKAEKRMRDVCSQVMAGMGDVLKERLMGISTNLDNAEKSKEEDEEV